MGGWCSPGGRESAVLSARTCVKLCGFDFYCTAAHFILLPLLFFLSLPFVLLALLWFPLFYRFSPMGGGGEWTAWYRSIPTAQNQNHLGKYKQVGVTSTRVCAAVIWSCLVAPTSCCLAFQLMALATLVSTIPYQPTAALQGVSSSNAALLMKPSPAPAPPVSVSGGNQPQPHICHQNEGLASLGCFVNGRRDMPKHLKKKRIKDPLLLLLLLTKYILLSWTLPWLIICKI